MKKTLSALVAGTLLYSLLFLTTLSFAPEALAEECGCGDGAVPLFGCCGGEGQRPCVVDSVFSNCPSACEEGLITGFFTDGLVECVKPASLGDSCGPAKPCDDGMTCFPFAQQCFLTGEEFAGSVSACEAVYSPEVHSVYTQDEDGLSATFGIGASGSAGVAGIAELGVLYGADGRFGCYSQTCEGIETNIGAANFLSQGLWGSYDFVAGDSNVLTQEAGIGVSVSLFEAFPAADNFCDPEELASLDLDTLIGAGSALNFGASVSPVSAGCYSCTTTVINTNIQQDPPPQAKCKVPRTLPDGELDYVFTVENSLLSLKIRPGLVCANDSTCSAQGIDIDNGSFDPGQGEITLTRTFTNYLQEGISEPFPIGTTAGPGFIDDVIFASLQVENEAGLTDQCGGVLMVADCSPPEITGCPAPVTLECQGVQGAFHTPPDTARAVDACSAESAQIVSAPTGGSWYPLGVTPLRFDARNAWGERFSQLFESELAGLSSCVDICKYDPESCNRAQAARSAANAQGDSTVTVVDTTPPDTSASCPGTRVVECQANQKAGATWALSAAPEICDGGSVVPSCDSSSGDLFSLGTTTVNCSASDSAGNSDSCGFDVVVQDTTAPSISCATATTVECSAPGGAPAADFATFLGASSSIDACYGNLAVNNDAPSFFDVGNTAVRFSSNDASGNGSSCSAVATVVDTLAPTIDSLSLSESSFWPPNHRMKRVRVSVTASDTCDAEVTSSCRLISVTSNEPDAGIDAEDIPNDIELVSDLVFQVRAERDGEGDGRVYTATVECTDSSGGNSARASAQVLIPRNQGEIAAL